MGELESDFQKIQRVRLMADGHDAWDLSYNDIMALQYVLDIIDGRKPKPTSDDTGAETAQVNKVERGRDSER